MRKIIRYILPFMVGINLFMACESPGQNRQQLLQASALRANYPDSALKLLSLIHPSAFSPADRAYYSLVYTIAQDKSGLDVASDSLLRYVKAYYDQATSDSMYSKYCYYLGKYYMLNDSNRQAEYYLRASIKTSGKDYYTRYLAQDRLSKTLASTSPEFALQEAENAYETYTKHCKVNLYNEASLLFEIGRVQNTLGQYPQALAYFRKGLKLALSLDNKELISASYQDIALAKSNTNQKDSALWYIRKAWTTAPYKTENLTINYAHRLIDADSIDQGVHLLESICSTSNYSRKFSIYKLLTRCAIKKGNLEQIEAYTDSTLKAFSCISKVQKTERSHYYKENLELDKQNTKISFVNNWLSFIIFLLVIFVAVVICFVLYYKMKKEKITHEHQVLMVKQRAEEERKILLIKNYESQIELMRKYILSKINLQAKLDRLKENEKNNEYYHIDDETWTEIEVQLNTSDRNFVQRIKEQYPELTQDDIRFFMLIRLGFNTKELVRVYHISETSMKQKLNKYKQKINLNNPRISLRQYMLNY